MDGVDSAMLELECYEYDSGSELIDWLKKNVSKGHFDEIMEKLLNSGEKEGDINGQYAS